MQQRYYDPIAGRFLSVDPVTTDANTGKSFNRYAYGNNNPYKYVDPDGRDNIVFQVGGSLVVGGGGEGFLGIYISNSPRLDVGFFASGGLGGGLNVGLAASGGVIKGPVSNVAGSTINVNVSTGVLSGTVINDAGTGKPIGATFGAGAKLGASVTGAKTGTFSLRDAIFGKQQDGGSKDAAKPSTEAQKDPKTTPPPPPPQEQKPIQF